MSTPSKNSKVVFNNIVRSGGNIIKADIVGLVDECFKGHYINCTEGGYEVFPCDTTPEETTSGTEETTSGTEETTSETEVKREVIECGENCECGASIPSDGFLLLIFEDKDCTATPFVVIFGLLDTCIQDVDIVKYTANSTTYISSIYESETCEGTSDDSFEGPLGQCKNYVIVVRTNDLEEPTEPVESPESVDTPEFVDSPDLDGSVATWIASVVLIVLSVVISA